MEWGRGTRRVGHGLALLGLAGIACLLACLPATAAVITLKIRAINPSQVEKKKVTIRQTLPQMAKPGDVVNAGELEVSYDVATQAYVVGKEIELAPAEVRTFDVVIKDIWELPESDVRQLSDQAAKLTRSLKGTDKGETAAGLQSVIDGGVKAILDKQASASVGLVKPVDHIRVYEANREALVQIRKDMGVLENLAIAAGQDLDAVLGLPKVIPPVATLTSATGDVVVLHIKITNPSLTQKRTTPLKHDLPAEIKSTDVVDAAGLQISFDGGRNLCYAYAEGVELGPQESKVFDVKIRDPWSGAVDRLPAVARRCEGILAIIKDKETYKAVDSQAHDILKAVDEVKSRKGPSSVNQDYVAFARDRATAVHELETRVQRLEEIFQPNEKPVRYGVPVMEIPRPDKRTTWILIYIILAFLGVFSVMFYLRWYGKGKDEKLKPSGQDKEAGRPAGNKPA